MTTYTHLGHDPRSIVWAAIALSAIMLAGDLGATNSHGTGERSMKRKLPVAGQTVRPAASSSRGFADPRTVFEKIPDSPRR